MATRSLPNPRLNQTLTLVSAHVLLLLVRRVKRKRASPRSQEIPQGAYVEGDGTSWSTMEKLLLNMCHCQRWEGREVARSKATSTSTSNNVYFGKNKIIGQHKVMKPMTARLLIL